MIPTAGQVVRVRTRRYLVEGVAEPVALDHAALVSLSCLDDDAQGDRLDVLWQKELDAEIIDEADWRVITSRGFDKPREFAAFLHTVRWGCVTSTNPRLLQAPYRAGIDIKHYQLEPLRKALALPRVNLFIADDVGLGKTIEAGLILRELLMRQKVRRVVVACPPSVELQWKDELEQRFGLQFEVYDREFVARRRRERGFAVNPWTTHSRFIISHARLRDEDYASLLRDWLGEFAAQSLLILDEAHHAAPASGQRYAIDSQFTKSIRDLAPRFEHRLFLSATPHNGHSNSFSALLELLDPQRFVRGVPVKTAKELEPIMVRRLKGDLRAVGQDFPERKIVQEDIDGLAADAPELLLSRLLDEYADLREQKAAASTAQVRAASLLVVTQLQKRLLSSIEAFARTLRVHRDTIQRENARIDSAPAPVVHVQQLTLLREEPGSDDDAGEMAPDEIAEATDAEIQEATAAVAAATRTSAPTLREREKGLLDQMTHVAEAARHQPDPRVRRLVEWLGQHACPGLPPIGSAPTDETLGWNPTRVIVFTEFVDTLRWLEQHLRAAIGRTHKPDHRIATYHGGSDQGGGREKREEIKRRFNADPHTEPLRILLCTDAAREGINLQSHCADLFHFDLPWNPSRIEQRNGRIDRTLQTAAEVRCHYFYFRQRPEDSVLKILVRKVETIRSEHVSLAPVLDARIGKLLDGGIRRDGVQRLVRDIDAVDGDADKVLVVAAELEQSRERNEPLRKQLDELRRINELSMAALRFDSVQFRDALSCALEMVHAEPLRRIEPPQGLDIETWAFPALDRQHGADASWAVTMDALRPPRKPEQKPWEWRRESPVRPIVFQDPRRLDDRTVHLHLEHRVVKRLLGRFVAQGFVHDQLSRACVLVTEATEPRVVLLGRLSLYGEGASRLHDEILAVTARWKPRQNDKPLQPFAAGRAAEAATVDMVERAFGQQAGRDVPKAAREQFANQAPFDVMDLQLQLDERALEAGIEATDKLHDRGKREAEAMVELLERQRQRIRDEQDKRDKPQQLLPNLFTADETKQLRADQLAWERRLIAIDKELVSEPERIRRSFEVRLKRLEPLGVVYLWPQAG